MRTRFQKCAIALLALTGASAVAPAALAHTSPTPATHASTYVGHDFRSTNTLVAFHKTGANDAHIWTINKRTGAAVVGGLTMDVHNGVATVSGRQSVTRGNQLTPTALAFSHEAASDLKADLNISVSSIVPHAPLVSPALAHQSAPNVTPLQVEFPQAHTSASHAPNPHLSTVQASDSTHPASANSEARVSDVTVNQLVDLMNSRMASSSSSSVFSDAITGPLTISGAKAYVGDGSVTPSTPSPRPNTSLDAEVHASPVFSKDISGPLSISGAKGYFAARAATGSITTPENNIADAHHEKLAVAHAAPVKAADISQNFFPMRVDGAHPTTNCLSLDAAAIGNQKLLITAGTAFVSDPAKECGPQNGVANVGKTGKSNAGEAMNRFRMTELPKNSWLWETIQAHRNLAAGLMLTGLALLANFAHKELRAAESDPVGRVTSLIVPEQARWKLPFVIADGAEPAVPLTFNVEPPAALKSLASASCFDHVFNNSVPVSAAVHAPLPTLPGYVARPAHVVTPSSLPPAVQAPELSLSESPTAAEPKGAQVDYTNSDEVVRARKMRETLSILKEGRSPKVRRDLILAVARIPSGAVRHNVLATLVKGLAQSNLMKATV